MTNSGHRERLRARFNDAPEKLADYEILELLLGHVLLRRDTKPIAKALLGRFTSLRGVLEARPAELSSLADIGPGIQTFLHLLREFMSRVAESPLKHRESLCSPEIVAAMAQQRLRALPHEEIWIAFMDNQNRLITWEKAARGTVDSTMVYPRDLLERALTLKATGFIMVHNHPGGNSSPSAQDQDLTQRILVAAQTLNIRFIDHVIVTDGLCYSIMTDRIIL
jgi:DNA repair protein RadC